MSERQPHPQTVPRFVARNDQPLIAVPIEHDGHEEVAYFMDEAAADHALRPDPGRPAIKLAGVWADLDGEQMLAELERIRHASVPTPPITVR